MTIVASTNAVQASAAGSGSVQPSTSASTAVGRGEGSPQIVDHLPAADPRKFAVRPTPRRAFAGETENPGQELPVAARPAVMARRR